MRPRQWVPITLFIGTALGCYILGGEHATWGDFMIALLVVTGIVGAIRVYQSAANS